MKWFGRLLAYCAAYIVFTEIQAAQAHDVSWAGLVVTAVVVVLFGSAAAWASNKASKSEQRKRDVRAAQLLGDMVRSIGSGQTKEFVLYLRPFFITARLPTKNTEYEKLPLYISHFTQEEIVDLETTLEAAWRPLAPLIALGAPGEHIGAGRIASSDDEWKNMFSMLAGAAKRILVLPSDHEGTKWEISWLMENKCLSKTVFVMPPRISSTQLDMEDYWLAVGTMLDKFQLVTPPYTETGLLFRFRQNGTVVQYTSLNARGKKALRKMFKSIAQTDSSGDA